MQKIAHLQYEAEHNEAVLNNEKSTIKQTDHLLHDQLINELQLQRDQLDSELFQLNQEQEIQLQKQNESSIKELAKLRDNFQNQYNSLQTYYNQQLDELTMECEIRLKCEIHEVEERKNEDINELIKNHEKNYNNMKQYYNSITSDNMNLIASLRDEIQTIRAKQINAEKEWRLMNEKNQQLSIPIKESEEKVESLRIKLMNYKKDSYSLSHLKQRLNKLTVEYKNICEEFDRMSKEYQNVQVSKQKLSSQFDDIIGTIHSRNEEKQSEFDLKLKSLDSELEVKKGQFASVLRASNLDPTVLKNVTRKLDDVLTNKNNTIDQLRYQQIKLTKAHDDLVRIYEGKLQEFNIPTRQINGKPIHKKIGNVDQNNQAADLLV